MKTYDVKIEGENGFEIMRIRQKDDAAAIIAAIGRIQAKRRGTGCYHTIKNISLVLVPSKDGQDE